MAALSVMLGGENTHINTVMAIRNSCVRLAAFKVTDHIRQCKKNTVFAPNYRKTHKNNTVLRL